MTHALLPELLGRSGLPGLPLPELITGSATVGSRSSAVAPAQQRIGVNVVRDAGGLAQPAASKGSESTDGGTSAERTSGPHLRAVVILGCALFWVATRLWAQQISLLPFILLCHPRCTMSTSAMWCTPTELVVSLGPVPMCLLRRRILYKDIASVTVVHGRFQVLRVLLTRSLRLWEPFGFVYGLTIGKSVVDIALNVPEHRGQGDLEEGGSKRPRARWQCWEMQPLLVSVDDADDVVAYILFRQEHGPEAPLPESLMLRSQGGKARWVWCDALDVLLSWHSRNQVMCDVCGLLLQPFWPEHPGHSLPSTSLHARTA